LLPHPRLGRMLPVMERCLLLRLGAALVFLALTASALQPVYRVDADLLFLPLNGVALNAHTGQVVWRLPRFDGQTYTNGRGLLLVSWVDVVQPLFHNRRFTRICRIRTRDGAKLWCRDWPDLEQWVVDTQGGTFYLHTRSRLQVVSLRDGQPDRGFSMREDGQISLLPLPSGGVLALDRGTRTGNQIEALHYQPGAAALTAELLPRTVYPFQGDGRGLLFYTREKGEFFLAAPFTALFHRLHPPREFPRASLDEQGYVFSDWQGTDPIVRGGTYDGTIWQAPRPSGEESFALAPQTALMMASAGGSTQIQAWTLTSGQTRYVQSVRGHFDSVASTDNALVLQSRSQIRLLNASTGAQNWEVNEHEGPLAAVAQTAVIFWEEGNELVGRARNNGALLWRVRFAENTLHGEN
ncbi:MAG: PQQ-binding-like beta-propeller repeat protein, partial [Terriglobales bacterium]